MADATILVTAEPTELPRATAATITIQNQSDTAYVYVAVANAAPATTVAASVLRPFEWGRVEDLSGDEKVWAWATRLPNAPSATSAPIFVRQEA